jgi:hypothetical protein
MIMCERLEFGIQDVVESVNGLRTFHIKGSPSVEPDSKGGA